MVYSLINYFVHETISALGVRWKKVVRFAVEVYLVSEEGNTLFSSMSRLEHYLEASDSIGNV